MEKGGSSNIEYKYTRRARTSVIREGGAARAAATATNAAPLNVKRDADEYMPIVNITRILRRILPTHAKITDDAKEAIQECVSEFISFITAEANRRCRHDYRTTVTPEDVLAAMASLGFDDYLESLTIFLNNHRTARSRTPSVALGIKYRSLLGETAASKLASFTTSNRKVLPRCGRCHHHRWLHQQWGIMSPSLPPPVAATMEDEEEFDGVTNEYILHNHGGGVGSSGGREFDPFQYFDVEYYDL